MAHFVDGRVPTGGVGTGPAGHALARALATRLTTAGALPSRRVVRRDDPRYYDPLGRPLRMPRFRHRLIRAHLLRPERRRRASPLVERFFGLLTEKALRRGSHISIPQLRAAILAFIAAHNEKKKPFAWTKTADEILDKMRRFGIRT